MFFSERSKVYVLALVALIVGTPLFTGAYNATVPTEEIIRSIEQQGFSNVSVTERANMLVQYKGCGKGDAIMVRFTAKNGKGDKISAIACRGNGLFARGTTIPPVPASLSLLQCARSKTSFTYHKSTQAIRSFARYLSRAVLRNG